MNTSPVENQSSPNPLLDVIKQELRPEHVAGTIAEKVFEQTKQSGVVEDPRPSEERETLPVYEEPKEEVIPPSMDDLAKILLEETPKPEVKIEAREEVDEVEFDEDEEVVEAKGPKESIKALRRRSNELKRNLEEREATLSQLQEEVKRFRSGDGIPEEVKRSYEERIQQLEQYERLHALKLSKEYQSRFIEPAKQLKEEATRLAADYGVDPSIFEKALKIDNKRELNSYLRNYFDDVGVLESKEVLEKIKTLRNDARQAEAEPAQALQRIQEEHRALESKQAQIRTSRIIDNSKRGWTDSLMELTSSGEYPELTIKPNNEEHNKVVRPILQAAAEEYGKFVKLLAEDGVKDLSPDVAKIVSKRFLLSQAAGIMAASRASHYERAEELVGEAKRHASMKRPPLGASGDGGRVSTPKAPSSPEEAADLIIAKVLRK